MDKKKKKKRRRRMEKKQIIRFLLLVLLLFQVSIAHEGHDLIHAGQQVSLADLVESG